MEHSSFLMAMWKTTKKITFLQVMIGHGIMAGAQHQEEQDQGLLPMHPQLDGMHFRITALQENGFLDIHYHDNNNSEMRFSGYLIDMLEAISSPDRANFTYTLSPPSGYGSKCNSRIPLNQTFVFTDTFETYEAYDAAYRTQYNCGEADVNDIPLSNHSTDMYLGMYYVTPDRQRQNQFTIPFLPPFSSTLAMMGTATGIPDFDALVEQQADGTQPAACAPGGAALTDFVAKSYPGLEVMPFFGGEDEIYQAFQNGTCQVYIVDYPVAAQFVLRRSRNNQCMANNMPIGVIGDPMHYGLSHYALGIRRDISADIERTLSYWINTLLSCNPRDENGPCPDGNFATFYEGQGGEGDECGYVLFSNKKDESYGLITFILFSLASVVLVVLIYTPFHYFRLRQQALRQREIRYAESEKAARALADRERELNDFIAHEIRNPLSNAIAALAFVSSKSSDPVVVPDKSHRNDLLSDIGVIDSSLQFVNELLRNILDLNRSANKEMKLDIRPTDVLSDILQPVQSILFMRVSNINLEIDCPENLIIETDRIRLKQIIFNLAGNASKFVETGYIRLRAEVVDGENVVLHVEDSGPGIPLSKREQLFAKFQESLDLLNQGTGIGLSVCRNLSILMGADLFLDEDFYSGIKGSPGSRFTLRLNRQPLTTDETLCYKDPLSHEFIAPHPTIHRLPEKISVLFVDDDLVLRKLFVRTISRVAPDWKLQVAANGETALQLVEKERFDMIFLDEYMASFEKQLLGTETVRILRAKGVESVICGVSANDKEAQFLDAGANAFLFKPFPAKSNALKAELVRILYSQDHMAPEKACQWTQIEDSLTL